MQELCLVAIVLHRLPDRLVDEKAMITSQYIIIPNNLRLPLESFSDSQCFFFFFCFFFFHFIHGVLEIRVWYSVFSLYGCTDFFSLSARVTGNYVLKKSTQN